MFAPYELPALLQVPIKSLYILLGIRWAGKGRVEHRNGALELGPRMGAKHLSSQR